MRRERKGGGSKRGNMEEIGEETREDGVERSRNLYLRPTY